jgi:hypothetical protein
VVRNHPGRFGLERSGVGACPPLERRDKKTREQVKTALVAVILGTQEVEMRRIRVGGQPRQILCKTLSGKYPTHKKKAGGVAPMVQHLPRKCGARN